LTFAFNVSVCNYIAHENCLKKPGISPCHSLAASLIKVGDYLIENNLSFVSICCMYFIIRIQFHIVGPNQKKLKIIDVVTFVEKKSMPATLASHVKVSIILSVNFFN